MAEWKKGQRVQREEWKDGEMTIHVGEITDVEYDQREKRDYSYSYGYNRNRAPEMETYTKKVTVNWAGGSLETLEPYMVHSEDTEVERAYRLAVKDAQRRMNEKMAQAAALLDEAVEISEETGIPLDAGISPLSQSYIPQSMSEKWPGVDREFMNEIANAYGEYDGWQHSAVC